jgi:hypothetical protein
MTKGGIGVGFSLKFYEEKHKDVVVIEGFGRKES